MGRNQWISGLDHDRRNGQRRLLALLGLICLGLVGGALYVQEALGQYPCPLCIIQRYLFLLIALLAFIGAAFNRPTGNRMAAWLILLVALVGIGVAGRLVYVQANPGESCGIDVVQLWTDAIPLAQWAPTLFQATGMCGDAYEPILGLSMATWGLVGFVAIAVGVLLGLRRHAAPRRERRMFR